MFLFTFFRFHFAFPTDWYLVWRFSVQYISFEDTINNSKKVQHSLEFITNKNTIIEIKNKHLQILNIKELYRLAGSELTQPVRQ